LDYFVEGWSNQGIAWQFNYTFKIFKDTYKTWIQLHNKIVSDKRTIPIQDMVKREEAMGIVLSNLSNKME
jgi:hypothetical protein